MRDGLNGWRLSPLLHAGTMKGMNHQPHQRYYRPGEYLFKEGEPSRCLFLVKKGTVSIRKMKGAAYVELARIYSNEVLGELSFFDRHPRSAAAIALTEVEVLELHFDSLDKIWKQVPDYLKTIIAALAERLRKANDTIRRLQNNVVTDAPGGGQAKPDELDPAAVLAATAGIGENPITPEAVEAAATDSNAPEEKPKKS